MEEVIVFNALLTAVLLVPVMIMTHIFLMRFKPQTKPLMHILVAFLMYVISWLDLFVYKISDEAFYWPALVAGLSTQIFFLLGYLEFFSMVCRGFSLRILVDIHSKKEMSLEEIQQGYGEKGVEWMLAKRIETLLSLGLVDLKDEQLSLKKPLSWFLGRVGLSFKGFLNMGKGG